MGNLIAQRESYTRAGKTDDIDRTFTHDDLSRLTNTDQYVNGELNKQNVERFLTYDRNGNLLTLIRYADGVQSSNRQYTYIGNRLDRMEKDKVIAWDEIEVHPGGPAIVVPEKVTEDNGTAALDAGISIDTSAVIRPVDPGIILHSRYAHDRNGNLTYDMELQTNFAYNSLNLLEKAMRNDTIVAKYSYLADGTKLSAVNADDCGFAYRSSFTYRTDAEANRVFESTPFGGGRIVATAGNDTEVRYFLTDHLGSVRVVATDQNNVLERNDYYPFGKRWDTASLPVSDNRDHFNGKEDQVFIGDCLADYGARMYDRERGRWLTQDPKAENFINSSQYCFCGNNPISRIDINGEDWYSYQKKEYNEQGEMIEYTAYAFTEATSQQELDDAGINGTYLGAVVVIFAGSLNEKLGTKESDPDGLYINGDGAITAQVTVYGPKGESDIARYTGFTMSSDFKKYGAIADGEYTVNYLVPGKSAPLPSNYAVNGGNPVDCLNGINPSPISPYSATQKNGIYIHATNINGKAGGNIAASTGCLLIQGGAQWNRFQSQIGKRDFKLILYRQ